MHLPFPGSETLSTRGADLIFESSADISPGSTLDASGTDNSSGGGKPILEFQLGGTGNGTINVENATFKIGSAYAVPGTLKTNGSTTWELGNVQS